MTPRFQSMLGKIDALIYKAVALQEITKNEETMKVLSDLVTVMRMGRSRLGELQKEGKFK